MNTKSLLKAVAVLVLFVAIFAIGFFGAKYFEKDSGTKEGKPVATTATTPNSTEPKVKGFQETTLENCIANPEEDFTKDGGKGIGDIYYLYAGVLALAKKDVASCDALPGSEKNKQACRDRYYVFSSRATGVNQCDKIADKEVAAFCSVGFTKDLSVCDTIATDNNKVNCRVSVTKDPQQCEGLSVEFKAQCLDNISLAKAFDEKNVSFCNNISLTSRGGRFNAAECKVLLSSNSQKEWEALYANNVCYEKYAAKVAEEIGDKSMCEKIPQKDLDNKIMYEECKK